MSIRPVPEDPSADKIASMMDLRSQEWWLTNGGEYHTAAVEVMKADGTNYDRLVALEWPTRLNHGTEEKTIRLLIHPEDAIGLAAVLAHTSAWMLGLDQK